MVNLNGDANQWKAFINEDFNDGTMYAVVQNKSDQKWRLSNRQILNASSSHPYSKRHLKWLREDFSLKGVGLSERLFEVLSIDNTPVALRLRSNLYGLSGGNVDDDDLEEFFPHPYCYQTHKAYDIYHYKPETVVARIIQISKQFQKDSYNPLTASDKNAAFALQSWEPSVDLISQLSSSSREIQKEFLQFGWSFEKYMNVAVKNPDIGYYATGRVEFYDPSKSVFSNFGSDFATIATLDNSFASQIACQSFMMWKTMLEAGDVTIEEPFDILEIGAGSGLFSDNALTFLEAYAKDSQDPLYSKFWNVVRYKIGEFSPALRARQATQNQKWLQKGKLEIYDADATDLTKTFKMGSIKGLVFSNELIDAFPLHRIQLNSKRQVEVLTVIPTLELKKAAPLGLQLQRDSQYYKHHFKDLLNSQALGDRVVISCGDLNKIPKELLVYLEWRHVFLSAEFFPDVLAFVDQFGSDYFKNLPSNTPVYINTHTHDFMRSVSDILAKGFVFSVDYGGNHLEKPERSIRTYGFGLSKPNPKDDLFNSFGLVDITSSVNFTLVGESGKKLGLEPLAFFKQKELSNIMKDLLSGSSFSVEKTSNVNDNFRVLIQQQKGTQAKFAMPCRPDPLLFSELYGDGEEPVVFVNNVRLYSHALRDFFNVKGIDHNIQNFLAYCEELYGKNFMPEYVAFTLIQLMQTYDSIESALTHLKNSTELSKDKKMIMAVLQNCYTN